MEKQILFKIVSLTFLLLTSTLFLSQFHYAHAQSASATYDGGDIETDRDFTELPGESSCPGYLAVTIPENAIITGVDVEYEMSTDGFLLWFGNMDEQRSQLRCVSDGGDAEPNLAEGIGGQGTYEYSREGLDIANNVTGGGEIEFELHAGRTNRGNECNTIFNMVDNNTWTVTVHYILPDFEGAPFIVEQGKTVAFTDQSIGDFSSWDWDFGDGADPATATGEGPHDVVYNSVGLKTVSLTVDGEHTVTKEDYITVLEETKHWYTFQSGSWEDENIWTTDPSGTLLEGPEEIPGTNDQVTIIDGNEVYMESDDIEIVFLEVRSGKLDLRSTTGHDFTTITGEGTISLQTDNFPSGNASAFNAKNGGTVEFYDNSFELNQPHTFNNMVVNMNNGETLTLLADYNLNGDLTIENGEFRINNDTETDILTLDIGGCLTVNNNGSISVGEGDTRDGYSIQGGNMPALGEYHSVFHQINLKKGDFINNGSARFTNQDAPDFREFTTTGAAVVNFTGNNNQRAELNGITDFYNLVVNKGNGQTYILEIESSHKDNFALYGPNNVGNNTGGEFTDINPEIRKALWIRNGTLRLRGQIDIPSLTEGNEDGGRGDFHIPSNAKLWIDGFGVDVYTTIAEDNQRPDGTTWHNEDSGHTELTLYGNFRIDKGFFGTRHSAGFIYREEGAATIRINGGIVDAAAFRSSGEGGGGRTYYEQTGGEVRVRGERTYDGEEGGEVSGDWPLFGLIYPESTFIMSGGEIKMIGKSRDDDNNDHENNGFYIASEDYNVTGGTVKLMLQGGDEYFIHTTSDLWNFEMERLDGNHNIDVRFTHELTIKNDLLIGDNCILHPRRDDGETNHDLYVGRNFVLGQSEDSNAEYNSRHGGDGNNTIFFGDEDGNIQVANTTDFDQLEFYDFTIDKNSHDDTIRLISNGRDAVNVETGPYDESPILLHNHLHVKRGMLDYNSFSIYIDNDATVENRSTIGIIGDPGFLNIIGADEIVVPLGTDPAFGNLIIDNSNDVSLTGGADITIGNLGLRRGIFDIGSQGITIEEDIVNIDDVPGSDEFSDNKLILTAGNHSDRGVTLKIPSEGNGTYHFPIGTWNFDNEHIRYAYAEPTLSGVPEGGGYLQINGIPSRLPTLGTANPERYLQYYWRVRHSGFSSTPDVENVFRSYEDDYEGVNNWNNHNQVVGKIVNNIRSPEHPNEIGELIDDSPIHILAYDINELETGEFTAARSTMFNGDIRIYYTRDHGASTGDAARQPEWRDHNTWTRSDHNDFDPESPHCSSNPDAGNDNYPEIGDIAVIGWVPWDDPKEELRGLPHGVWIDDTQEEIAQLQFTQMTDEEGNPVPREYRSNFQFRPTLCINDNDGEFAAGWVEGEGMFWIRIGDPDLSLIDLGDFVAKDSTYIVYENFDANRTYLNTPDVVPNIIFANDGWGSNNHNVTISKDMTTLGNFEILGNLNLILNDGETGDINVGRDFVMFEITDPVEGNPSGGGAELAFQNDGNPRNITIMEDLDLNNSGALIRVRDPNSADALDHNITLYGNIIQNTGGGGSPNGLRFYTANDDDKILLNILGEESKSWIHSSGESANLHSMTINKGNSANTTFTINTDFNIDGPAGGNSDEKPIQLVNGKLILNHPDIDITITSGGEPYVIPSTAGLAISQGEVSAAGSNVNLRGLLRIENTGEMTINNSIAYSSAGHAILEIADSGILEVGANIKGRTTDPNAGILKYRQSGGTVNVGSANPAYRGVFEVFNTGSEFIMTDGNLNIVRSHDSGQDRAALYLHPTLSSVSQDATITIGSPSSSDDIIEIESSISLPSLTVNGNNDVIAKLKNYHLSVDGDLTILGASNAFDGNGLNLTVKGNILNEGISSLQTNTLFMDGNVQTIEGDLTLNRWVIKPTTSVTLQNNTDIEVNDDFHLNTGALNSQDNTVTALADVYNYAEFNSDPEEGGLLMTGSDNQRIFGDILFGRLEIDKTEGLVTLQGPMELENNLILTNGNLNLGSHRLTLDFDSEVEGPGDFGTDRMIITNGVFESNGLAKRISTGNGNFTFPIGVEGKYTPVELDYSSNDSEGLVAVTPVDAPHMTITTDPEHDLDILDYHWYIESEGLSNFSGDLYFHYDTDDVNGDASNYIAARLYGAEWYKYPEEYVEENDDYFYFENRSNLAGEYTAGTNEDIPDEVPLYISTNSGDFEIGTNWKHFENETPATAGGPSGVRVLILDEHDITVYENRRMVYELTLEGTINLDETYAHNFRQVSGDGTLLLETALLPAGRFNDFFNTPGSTIVYEGNEGYSITDRYTEFQNVILRGNGTRKLQDTDPRNIIHGNLNIEDNVDFEADGWLELRGDLTIADGPGYDVSNWTYFTGTQPQTITGNFTGNAAINNFYIDKASEYLTIDGDIDVNNMIYLQNGIVNVPSGSQFRLLNNYPFYSSSDFDQSWIEGPLTRRLSWGSYHDDDWDNLFPVGKNNKRRFVRTDNIPSGNHNEDWTVEYFDASPLSAGMDPESFDDPLAIVSSSEYWSVEGPSYGNPSANIQLNWGEESGVGINPGDEDFLVVANWNDASSSWITKGGNASFTNNPDNTEGYVISTTTTSFSEQFFTLGSTDEEDPYPVELLTFEANLVKGKTHLQWVTASEINNDYFTIMRSRDGRAWQIMKKIPSKAEYGYSNSVLFYETWDKNIPKGVSYYKLKQTDFDGTTDYSDIVKITNIETGAETNVKVFPNPNKGKKMSLQMEGFDPYEFIHVTIVNAFGEKVYTNSFITKNNGKIMREIKPNLNAGVYFVICKSKTSRKATRIVVQ